MANVSEFSIGTYLRKPGYWRAAITPKGRTGVGGQTVRSVVTPDDFASEAEAQWAAEQLIRNLDQPMPDDSKAIALRATVIRGDIIISA